MQLRLTGNALFVDECGYNFFEIWYQNEDFFEITMPKQSYKLLVLLLMIYF